MRVSQPDLPCVLSQLTHPPMSPLRAPPPAQLPATLLLPNTHCFLASLQGKAPYSSPQSHLQHPRWVPATSWPQCLSTPASLASFLLTSSAHSFRLLRS